MGLLPNRLAISIILPASNHLEVEQESLVAPLFPAMIPPLAPHALQPQCAVKLDQNLKLKLAIIRQCTSVTGQTDGH